MHAASGGAERSIPGEFGGGEARVKCWVRRASEVSAEGRGAERRRGLQASRRAWAAAALWRLASGLDLGELHIK